MDNIYVPGNLTRGMSEEDKQYFQDSYKNSAFVLRAICKEVDKRLDQLVIDSESMDNPTEILTNVAQRKALRYLKSMLVKPLESVDNE